LKNASSNHFIYPEHKDKATMNLPYSTSAKNQPVKIRMGEGIAAEDPITMVQQFDRVVAKYGDKPALHQKVIAKVR
jgi:hypothetical protein